MNKIIVILFLFVFCKQTNAGNNPFRTGRYINDVVFGTTYYIDPTGNDVTGTGSIGNPWASLYKACNSVSGSGDLIHVNAGTYVETNTCLLSVGVSIEGADSSTAIIQSTLTAAFIPIIRASSAVGTNGNQHISNIKIDGTMTVQWGILIEGRSNFSIHDISMKDVFSIGVLFDGGVNAGEAATYGTGNSFYNNRILNCAEYAGGYARGCFCFGSQQGMLIYNNIITQDQRAIGLNGEPVKYWNGGFTKGCKIYNNTLRKKRLYATAGVNDWDFCMELYIQSGIEIYNNTLYNGCIDLPAVFKGTYSYGAWIHDNYITCDSPNAYRQSGIIVEVLIQNVIIERNTINNMSNGVYMTPRIFDVGIPFPGANTRAVYVRNNLMTNVVGESGGSFVNFGGGSYQVFDSCFIYNNTCLYQTGLGAFIGIYLPFATSGSIGNIQFYNNIITGSTYATFYQDPSNTLVYDSLKIYNNDLYGNTGADSIFAGNGHGVNFGWTSNININPAYTGNYIPTNSTVLTGASDGGAIGWTGGTNVSPVANAGADTVLIQPTSSLTIVGSGTDADGSIVSQAWTQVSGPATITFTNGTTFIPTLSGLTTAGTYVVRLTVTDNLGATGTSDRTITVRAAPTVNGVINKVYSKRVIIAH